MKRHRHFRAARLSNHQGTRIATKQGRDNHGLHGCHRYISAVTFFVAVILRTSVSSVVLPFCSATPVNVHAFTVKWNQLTTSYEPTLGISELRVFLTTKGHELPLSKEETTTDCTDVTDTCRQSRFSAP